jgi:hypothetical protein
MLKSSKIQINQAKFQCFANMFVKLTNRFYNQKDQKVSYTKNLRIIEVKESVFHI